MIIKLIRIRTSWTIFFTAFFLLAVLGGCRNVSVLLLPSWPKQGDIIEVRIGADDADNITELRYDINGEEGVSTISPVIVSVDTCKFSGDYLTQITVRAQATWDDGEVKTYGPTDHYIDKVSEAREDDDAQYSIYVAHDHDDWLEGLMIRMANRFFDRFDSMSRVDYRWAQERFYTSDALDFTNASDLIINFGHGSHHHYFWGPDGANNVNLADTEFGAFAPCHSVGDAEHIVFASCDTLSYDDDDGLPYYSFWVHNAFTKAETRPFTGLHHVLGFRTTFSCTRNQGKDLFREFANNMDDGMTMINAWQEAVGDELRFRDGENRGTVLFLETYRDETIFSDDFDYIYGNPNYDLYINTWE